jgi:hypothetical protein
MTTETAQNSFATRPATQKQIDFIEALLKDMANLGRKEDALDLFQTMAEQARNNAFSMAQASIAITELKTKVGELKKTVTVKAEWPAVSTGRYAYLKDENDPESVAFFHVVVTDSGFPLLWVYSSDEELPIKSVPQKMSILSKIKDLGELECMKFFGQKSKTCGECGRRLTTSESRDIGIGPICLAKRMG